MEEKKWHDLEELMNERGFQNLVKGIQAQNIAKISLYDVIERRWKMFIASLPEKEREHISTFVQCLKDENTKRVYMCSKDKQIGCGHADCQNFLSTLMNDGEDSTDAGEKDRKTEHTTPHSDSCFNNYWELAKLFLGVSIDDNIALRGGLDFVSSIKLMKNCWLFKFDNCDYIYSQILEDIELLVYAPSLTITEEQLNEVFQNLIMLLKNWKDSHVSCLDATTDINQLEHSVVDCKQIENKLLVKNVLEIIDSVLNLDKKEMDFNKNQTKLPKWSVAKSNISSLLVQVNEILSAPEPDEVSEMKEENEKLKKEIQTLKDQLDNNREDAFQENRRLKQIVKQCDKDICLARLQCNDCGWIIKGSERTFYSSGITNYNATNFKEIGRRYGPIHLALLPIVEGLRNMSCLPEFTVSTKEILDMHTDLQAKQSLGINNYYLHYWCHSVSYKETELKKLMGDMKMEPSEFYFLEPGETYTSK